MTKAVLPPRLGEEAEAVRVETLSMTRGVNQLLFSYLPARTVDWEDGLAIVQLGSVRLENAWEPDRAQLVLEELGQRLRHWVDHGGQVDDKFPDPLQQPGRFVIGEPRSQDARFLETALICRGCSRLVFRSARDLQALGTKARICPACKRPKLRQFGQVFVHGCGELIPVTEWLPRSKATDAGLTASSAPLRCRQCAELSEPAIPKGAERIRDMRVVCQRCKGVIAERITARCPRCIKKLPPISSTDNDMAEYERNVVPRIVMRLTNYQANEAYYPHSLSILRLRRPRVVAEDSPLVRELRSLLPVERQPLATTKGQRLMAIGRQIDAAEQTGNVAEVARLNSLLSDLLTGAGTAPREADANAAITAPDDVIRSIEESLAVLTEVATESMESVVGRAGIEGPARIDLARAALAAVGLSEIRLVRDLPIINATYGYTRRHFEPTYEELHVPGIPTTVRAFYPLDRSAAQRLGRIELEGTTPILAREGEHEGLFFALEPESLFRWLGLQTPTRASLLSGLEEVDRYHDEIWSLPRRRLLFGVLHTLSHVVMRSLSRLAGLERTSLGEYLFPPLPGFVVYANAGTFNLGVMEVVLRDHVLALLEDMADSGVRCVHDPDCIEKRGACVGCVQAPEVVCRVFNHGLSRALLIGGHAPWSDIGARERVEGFWSTCRL